MDDMTRILDAVEGGDLQAAEELLPLLYAELKRIAASKMAGERAGHTLQPTALVHEAWLRLGGADGSERNWNSREHFLSAAAEAMRRVLIDRARKRMAVKRGGDLVRATWDESKIEDGIVPDEVLAVDEALRKLEQEKPELAELVKLRYYVGLSIPEVAAALGKSESTIERGWRVARTWLFEEIRNPE